MHVIATAGHVDHGKSTLLRALTAMEPDRWAEERARGMTIDLGYVWTTLSDGSDIAFVDVPGHRRFVPNMLAGIGPVPAVLLVVAADEGWCRQTAEHVAALDALDVGHGVLVLTRADLGDAELAEAEARDYLAGTSLEHIPAVAVCAPAGEGLDALRDQLVKLVAALPADHGERPTRLWVDRMFSVRGSGTVVTGTLATGEIGVGDELRLAPGGQPLRVRGLQCLKQPVDHAGAVARVAVNLRGAGADGLERGSALVAPGRFADVTTVDARLVNPAEHLTLRPIMHVGSAAVEARVRRLGEHSARLTLARPLPLRVGDRALLRDPGGHRVLAGVIILDTLPPALRRRGAARERDEGLRAMSATPDPAAELARRGLVRRDDLVLAGVLSPHAATPPGATAAGEWLIDGRVWRGWQHDLPKRLDDWAAAHPLSPGMPRPAVIQALAMPDRHVLDALLAQCPDISSDNTGIHRAGVAATLPDDAASAIDALTERLTADPFAAPEAPQLQQAGLTTAHLAAAARAGRLVAITEGIYLLPDAPERAANLLARLPQPFTLSQARQALGTTRRVAVPLLELLDKQRLTTRVTDTERRVRGADA